MASVFNIPHVDATAEDGSDLGAADEVRGATVPSMDNLFSRTLDRANADMVLLHEYMEASISNYDFFS